MVEYALSLDNIFASLADSTRRDIISRISRCELSVSEIAQPYDMTIAAVSKHLKVLEHANMVIKRKKGKQQMVSLAPIALKDAEEYIRTYTEFWNAQLDSLENYLTNEGN